MATSIRLPPELEQRLDSLAARTGRTKAFYLRQAIEEHLEDLEDYYLASEVADRVRRGEEKTYSADQIRRELGLGD